MKEKAHNKKSFEDLNLEQQIERATDGVLASITDRSKIFAGKINPDDFVYFTVPWVLKEKAHTDNVKGILDSLTEETLQKVKEQVETQAHITISQEDQADIKRYIKKRVYAGLKSNLKKLSEELEFVEGWTFDKLFKRASELQEKALSRFSEWALDNYSTSAEREVLGVVLQRNWVRNSRDFIKYVKKISKNVRMKEFSDRFRYEEDLLMHQLLVELGIFQKIEVKDPTNSQEVEVKDQLVRSRIAQWNKYIFDAFTHIKEISTQVGELMDEYAKKIKNKSFTLGVTDDLRKHSLLSHLDIIGGKSFPDLSDQSRYLDQYAFYRAYMTHVLKSSPIYREAYELSNDFVLEDVGQVKHGQTGHVMYKPVRDIYEQPVLIASNHEEAKDFSAITTDEVTVRQWKANNFFNLMDRPSEKEPASVDFVFLGERFKKVDDMVSKSVREGTANVQLESFVDHYGQAYGLMHPISYYLKHDKAKESVFAMLKDILDQFDEFSEQVSMENYKNLKPGQYCLGVKNWPGQQKKKTSSELFACIKAYAKTSKGVSVEVQAKPLDVWLCEVDKLSRLHHSHFEKKRLCVYLEKWLAVALHPDNRETIFELEGAQQEEEKQYTSTVMQIRHDHPNRRNIYEAKSETSTLAKERIEKLHYKK